MQEPYVSFVVTSRNDNHGGDMHQRMQIFMRGLIHQCNKHQLPAEVVLVEWNPPSDRSPLHEVLPNPGNEDFLSARYITVPKALHQTLNFSERLPLFQMIAKNVGIRRAKAPFVLATNVDLLFSDELIQYLATRPLQQGTYYRANRCDIPATLDSEGNPDQWLEFATANIKKRLGKSRFYPNLTDTTSLLFKYWAMIPVFILASRFKRLLYSKQATIQQEMDTEACGDFTLMSKEDWLRIEGYPELEVYSLHIDSMGLIAANALGIKQEILSYDACTYHLEHDNGWEFKGLRDRVLFFTNKPVLEWWSIHLLGKELIKSGEGFNFNSPNWGFNDQQLEETTIGS